MRRTTKKVKERTKQMIMGDWEVFDKFTYTWFKKVRARLETEDVEQSRD